MRTFDELVDTLYKEKLESVAVFYRDPDLRTRFDVYMKKEYEGYFEHGGYLEKIKGNSAAVQAILNDWYNDELRWWGNWSDDAKYAKFTPDPAHVELWNLSAMVRKTATRKLNGEELTDEDKANVLAWVEQMKNLRPGVLKGNEANSDWRISEAIVDSIYVCKDTDIMSLGLHDKAQYIVRPE